MEDDANIHPEHTSDVEGVSKSFENLRTSSEDGKEAASIEPRESSDAAATKKDENGPLCLIVLGMAGSGKTTFVQKLSASLPKVYAINLDPAVVGKLPYSCKIDIRDTVNYTEVMRSYRLGPNGAIITSLNLFATQIDQIISLLEKRCTSENIVLIDTPGQIEVFTWSASGAIFLESLASVFPTAVIFVADVTKMSENPITFMSNMLYACSILYKSRVPLIIVLNKNDIIHHQEVLDWMTDFESFQEALDHEESYSGNLTRSLSLALEEFYSKINAVGFSSFTGDGLENVVKVLENAKHEYFEYFLPMYSKLKEQKQKREREREEEEINKVKLDIIRDKVRTSYSERPTVNVYASDDDDELVEECDDNEISEEESFKRFLAHQREA